MPSYFSFESIAARLDAGTYSPAIARAQRTLRQASHVPRALARRSRLATACDEVLAPALSCGTVAALLALLFA